MPNIILAMVSAYYKCNIPTVPYEAEMFRWILKCVEAGSSGI
jgi:hypothetical protein